MKAKVSMTHRVRMATCMGNVITAVYMSVNCCHGLCVCVIGSPLVSAIAVANLPGIHNNIKIKH